MKDTECVCKPRSTVISAQNTMWDHACSDWEGFEVTGWDLFYLATEQEWCWAAPPRPCWGSSSAASETAAHSGTRCPWTGSFDWAQTKWRQTKQTQLVGNKERRGKKKEEASVVNCSTWKKGRMRWCKYAMCDTYNVKKLCSRQFSIKPTERQSTDAQIDSRSREAWKSHVLRGSAATAGEECRAPAPSSSNQRSKWDRHKNGCGLAVEAPGSGAWIHRESSTPTNSLERAQHASLPQPISLCQRVCHRTNCLNVRGNSQVKRNGFPPRRRRRTPWLLCLPSSRHIQLPNAPLGRHLDGVFRMLSALCLERIVLRWRLFISVD